jgi:hypothetical protein
MACLPRLLLAKLLLLLLVVVPLLLRVLVRTLLLPLLLWVLMQILLQPGLVHFAWCDFRPRRPPTVRGLLCSRVGGSGAVYVCC